MRKFSSIAGSILEENNVFEHNRSRVETSFDIENKQELTFKEKYDKVMDRTDKD